MHTSKLRKWSMLVTALATVAVLLQGCGGGSDGAAGPAGAAGAPGTPGTPGTPGKDLVNVTTVPANSVPATADTSAAWKAFQPQVTVTSVTIASSPAVKFTVKDAVGNPVVGLGSTNKASTALVPSRTNLSFTLAKLVPGTNNEPGKWISYLVVRPVTVAEKAGTVAATASCDSTTAPTWCGTFPTSDSQGTLVDNGDGSYVYTFLRDIKQAATIVASLIDTADGLSKKADLGDVSYDPTATHRLGIIISGAAPGTGSNTPNAVTVTPAVNIETPGNFTYDFRPDGGTITSTRNIVKIDSCSECHSGKGLAHGFSRKDPQLCVTCHTPQVIYSFNKEAPRTGLTLTGGLTGTTQQKRADQAIIYGRSVGQFPSLIHKTHMGEDLLIQGYNFNVDGGAMMFNDNKYPQDPRNCTKCHDGSANAVNKTADGDNWKKVPSLLACGACHDGIDFATGKGTRLSGDTLGHIGGAKANNAQCVLCHDATTIPIYHRSIIASTNNPVVQDGVASFAYKISGVTINASRQLVVKFQILKDGVAQKFNSYAAGAVPITGFTDGPAFLVIYATGQDGIAAPADWNSGHDTLTLTDAWAQANGNTLSGPDATNTYTATIASSTTSSRGASHNLAVPADAKMVTAMLAGSFTQPGVSDALTGRTTTGQLPGVSAMMAATGNTPDGKPNVARRVIFSEAKCNSCHDRLGTKPNFHSGNYNTAMCAACHTPIQGGSTGWSASFRVWVHGIHGAEKRSVPFTWHAVSATNNYSKIGYPGVLKNCQQCHLPGTYDFSASQYSPALIAGMLNVQAATGKLNPASATNYVFPQVGGTYAYGLNVDNTTDYGTGWSIDKPTGVLVAKTTQDSNLVSSPITAVCSACHDASAAIVHMETNGGSFYDPRGVAVTRTETCLVCHGSGKVADIKVMHQ